MNAYAAAFLEDLGRADVGKRDRYRCRSCGSLWERQAADPAAKSARPSLLKVETRS